MKIETVELEIAQPERITSDYIDDKIRAAGLNAIHWAILKVVNDKLLLSINVLSNTI